MGNEKREGRGNALQRILNSSRKTQDRMKSKDTVPEKNRSIETLTGSLSFVAWKTIVL